MSCLDTCFGSLGDPRARNTVYRLGDLMVMMLAASLCGATTATEFAIFAEQRKTLLSRLIDYDRAPSHDTFSRLLRLIDPQAFGVVFARFAEAFSKALETDGADARVLAIDGKALRRAIESGFAASPPLTVSVFAANTRLCLAAAGVKPGANEIETALKVIQLIDITDKIITADALHCHHRMAQAIVARGGQYVLSLKGNRHGWHRIAKAAFDPDTPRACCEKVDTGFLQKSMRYQKDKSMMCFCLNTSCSGAETREISHGRHEWRRAEVVCSPTPLMEGHAAFIRLTTQRGQEKPITRFYMASFVMPPQEALTITREHWMIENALHWMLDVHLNEDMSRARKDHAPANGALLNRLARNILQIADQPKVPISHRIKKCNWNDDYLLKAIAHMR